MAEAESTWTPEVSFLSAAYRTEEHIAHMIDSVRGQSVPDWELVVVDNGMSDEIAAVVQSYDDPRIVLVRHENRGVVGALASAGARARGRWVAVLHSDDAVAPGYLEHLLAIVHADPGIDAVTPDAQLMVAPNRILRRTHADGHPRLRDTARPVTLDELVEGFLPYYTGLVRREAWDALGGYREAGFAEDRAFWLALVGAGYRLHVTDRALGRWRLEPGSVSHRTEGRMRQEAGRAAMLTAAVDGSSSPADRTALAKGLQRADFETAWVRFYASLMDDDLAAARTAITEAARARPDARIRTIAVLTRLAPELVRWAYQRRPQLQTALLPLTSRRQPPAPAPVPPPAAAQRRPG